VPEVWEEVPMVYVSRYKYMCCYTVRVKGIYHIYYVFCPLTISSVSLVSNIVHAVLQEFLTLRGAQSLPIDILSMIQSIFKVM